MDAVSLMIGIVQTEKGKTMTELEINNLMMKEYNNGYEQGRAEGHKITAEVQEKLSEKCCALADENRYLKEQLESMETEFVRLRAQMDIVYLIFGGK